MRYIRVRSIKARLTKVGVEELQWPVQIPDLSPNAHFWDKLEHQLSSAKPSYQISLCNLLCMKEHKSQIAISAAKWGKLRIYGLI